MGLQNPHRRFDSAPRLQISLYPPVPPTLDLKLLHSPFPSARLSISIRVVSRDPPRSRLPGSIQRRSAVILKPFGSILLLAAIQATCLLGSSRAAAQRPGSAPQTPHGSQPDTATATADLLITLRDDKNSELSQPAKVTLRSQNGDPRGVAMSEKGNARFRSIPLGDYEVQVEVPGNATTRASVSLARA